MGDRRVGEGHSIELKQFFGWQEAEEGVASRAILFVLYGLKG